VASDRSEQVTVKGLKELVSALKAADPALVKDLNKEHKKVADEVVSKAQGAASSLGGVAGKSADALKARGNQAGASIVLDASGGFPFAFGAEFGAKRFHQFKPWRGNQYEDPLEQGVGYFLHPTLRGMKTEIMDGYESLIEKTLNQIAKD